MHKTTKEKRETSDKREQSNRENTRKSAEKENKHCQINKGKMNSKKEILQ